MSKNNLLIKRLNISKFDDFATYEWVHSESYNLFERFLIRKVLKHYSYKGQFAIDIRCNYGLVLREMYHVYDHCVRVDISTGIIRHAFSQKW